MQKLKKIVLFICLIVTPAASWAQNMRTYNVSSGLSANAIKGIVQDDRGYIWFGSNDGLNVFNGKEFKSYGCSYQPSGENSISALSIMDVSKHKDGRQIWVGTQSSSIYLFNPNEESFKEIILKDSNNRTQTPNLCYSLTCDKNGRLWIGTDIGLYVYDEDKELIYCHSIENSSLPSNSIHSVFCDSKGTIWIGTSKGLLKYNAATDKFTSIKTAKGYSGYKGEIHITTIAEDDAENIWLGTWDRGFAILDKRTNAISPIRPVGDNEYAAEMRVRSILPDNAETYWICTNYGLFKYDIIKNSLSLVVLSSDHPNDNIYSSTKDREGGVWIGTFFQGIHYLSPRARQIECYTVQNAGGHMNGSAVSAFQEDDNGMMYIASENGGLSLFDPIHQRFIKHGINISDNNLHALCIDEGKLYIGTYSQGLKIADLTSGAVRNITRNTHSTLPSNNIFSLYKTADQKIYIGTDRGCIYYDSKNGQFKGIDRLKGEFIYDILEDSHGNTWFSSYYNGVFKYCSHAGTWSHYMHNPSDSLSLPHNKTIFMYIDDADNLWICTEGGGVCRYDRETDRFNKLLLRQDGKPVSLSTVDSILSDPNGQLWLSSNNGLWVCTTDGTVIRHLTYEDGLQSNQYSFGAAFRSSTGRMYFGGVYGFNVINPESIRDSETYPTVTAKIILDDKSGKKISSTVFDREDIILPRNVSSFSIDFECLSYITPHKNEFAYRIDGQQEWTYTRESTVTLLNFPYGKHEIRVKARNGDGYWSRNEATLFINNLPPLAKSAGAKALYTLLTLGMVVGILIMTERRREEKSRIKFNEIKSAQEQESYKAKIDFFTHVAHEIKTPVTLIKAPLEVILQNHPEDEDRHNLEIMSQNTDRLLNLVNQLLDFKKISSDGHSIRKCASYPAELVRNVTNRFDGNSLGNINIRTILSDDSLQCVLDPEAYTKIVSNLMTNAIKHAVSRIEVKLVLNGEILHLEVSDDGCGIPEDEHKRIFDSFYQINTSGNPRMSGAGLGLSLVKLLVCKHDGNVYVDSTMERGCRICVDIPYILPPTSQTEQASSDINDNIQHAVSSSSGANLLIVEDTADMLDFISGIFKDRHNIHKASNGKEALEILLKEEIDIIISDISMPVMNGFELVQEIRRNDTFCHVPVIMLTVENALESKIKGLEYGADAYIEKPFSTSHLTATVDNLINRRNAILKRYTSSPLKQENETIILSRDQDWFEHLTRYINENIQENEISMENLASELNMSHSSLHRKLKGLTGLTPVEFVRLIRLKKAAVLLSSGSYRVNEVAYMVGFCKPSYFSALFKKQFGVLPKDFKG